MRKRNYFLSWQFHMKSYKKNIKFLGKTKHGKKLNLTQSIPKCMNEIIQNNTVHIGNQFTKM